MINVFQPTLGEQELAAVTDVFASGWLGRGARTTAFVQEFADHLGVAAEHLVPVNSCTEALFTTIELLGIGASDEVVMPSISFVGAANAVAAAGARPVFCDVDPHTLNLTVDHLAAKINSRTSAVMLLHYGGYPGQLAEIAALCDERGIPLIEDAACAVASRADGRACGTVGAFGAWSFDAMKILVMGDGGMLYCREPNQARRAAQLTYLGLGKTSGISQAVTSTQRWWEIDIECFGRRSSINDIDAAIGSVQLRRLPQFVARRREIVERYETGLAGLEGLRQPPALPAGHTSSYYFYWVGLTGGIRDEVARHLYERGIYTTFRYHPLHLVAAYGSDARLPGAERAAEETLCLPLHQGMDDAMVEKVIDETRAAVLACREAGRLSAQEV
ncbi:aminotransferase DegT [Rhizocola hellebori]|uniref:Aminotransferase DegT n=1 Tax=Rhizocola hellebori TaxID=1392758 RepID=A0A8J3Q4C1_9ACTN|nr:DegT/DnrJ/EryC1/StrS family aminotransferase [Rhizocola hellebori]GIH03451.1 aminotransferase DegT [Rhizocola hellebori]